MILHKSFEDLLNNKVNLNPTRLTKIQTAHSNVRDYLKNHEKIKPFFKGSYLQGSYAQKTAIKPVNENDYDVDVVLALDWKDAYGDFKSTTKLKQTIYSALEDSSIYKDKLMPHHSKRCVSLQYSEFHLDILPAHSDDDGTNVIWIIDKQDEWIESNPKDLSLWCTDLNKETDNKFKRIVRIMKYWRNHQFGENHTPKSIILTVMIGQNISYSNISTDRTLVETLEKIAKNYEESDDEVPEILNPSLTTENLSRNWKLSDYNKFIKRIKKAAITARKALDEEKDVQKAIDLWNSPELFAGNLPNSSLAIQKDIEDAMNVRNKQKSESLFIGSSGLVDVNQKDSVGKASGKDVRHFGWVE